MDEVNFESLVINGSNHIEPVETEIGLFKVRPLTIGERSQIKAMAWRAISARKDKKSQLDKPDMDISLSMDAVKESQDEQRFMVLAKGLSCNGKEFEIEQIKSWIIKESILDLLFDRILAISEVSIEDLKPFSEISARR